MLPIKIQATIEVLEPCKFEGGEKIQLSKSASKNLFVGEKKI